MRSRGRSYERHDNLFASAEKGPKAAILSPERYLAENLRPMVPGSCEACPGSTLRLTVWVG